MNESATETVTIAAELRRALDNMLLALQNIARGQTDQVMETDFAIDHPVGALAASLQEVSSALAESREDRQKRESELKGRIDLIEQQRRVIVELSTPVIEVWDGILALPLIGTFDQERATKMTQDLLEAAVEREASLVVLDVTGLNSVDAGIADHFLRMAKAVRLLGADCVLSGVRPNLARTVVSMGVDVDLRSFPTLGAALQSMASKMGIGPATSPQKPAIKK